MTSKTIKKTIATLTTFLFAFSLFVQPSYANESGGESQAREEESLDERNARKPGKRIMETPHLPGHIQTDIVPNNSPFKKIEEEEAEVSDAKVTDEDKVDAKTKERKEEARREKPEEKKEKERPEIDSETDLNKKEIIKRFREALKKLKEEYQGKKEELQEKKKELEKEIKEEWQALRKELKEKKERIKQIEDREERRKALKKLYQEFREKVKKLKKENEEKRHRLRKALHELKQGYKKKKAELIKKLRRYLRRHWNHGRRYFHLDDGSKFKFNPKTKEGKKVSPDGNITEYTDVGFLEGSRTTCTPDGVCATMTTQIALLEGFVVIGGFTKKTIKDDGSTVVIGYLIIGKPKEHPTPQPMPIDPRLLPEPRPPIEELFDPTAIKNHDQLVTTRVKKEEKEEDRNRPNRERRPIRRDGGPDIFERQEERKDKDKADEERKVSDKEEKRSQEDKAQGKKNSRVRIDANGDVRVDENRFDNGKEEQPEEFREVAGTLFEK